MRYVSTRGQAAELSFEDVLLQGLAEDGGLYTPIEWPTLNIEEIRNFQGASYGVVAERVIRPYLGDAVPSSVLQDIISASYDAFTHAAVTPLRQIDEKTWLLELFRGPTLAFKDIALQLVARLFDHVLTRSNKRITVVAATSGDTGSAAIEAMKGRDAIDIFVLHPHNRTSEVQRRQMTTVSDPNVHNIAIEGTFDDCQSLVKAMFAENEFRTRISMAGVNSINWARVMAQIVYYFTSAVALGAPDRRVSFAVPTGNFGDIFAGYAAKRMGLPIERLVIATNTNDILVRTMETGRYEVQSVVPTHSPSMDIQVSSNFERLLFEAFNRDADAVHAAMSGLKQSGSFSLDPVAQDHIRNHFDAKRVSEQETAECIATMFRESGGLIDPHTAVGVAAAGKIQTGPVPMIVLSTASPAKFPEIVEQMTKRKPEQPPQFEGLLEKKEHFSVLANDLSAVKEFVQNRTRVRQ